MTQKIYYPRLCDSCGRIYQIRQNYSRHITSGTCERTRINILTENNLIGNNNITSNAINANANNVITGNHNSPTINNNISPITINFNVGERMSEEEIKSKIDQVLNLSVMKELKELLHKNNITDGWQTFDHLHNNSYTLRDVKESLNGDVLDSLLDAKLVTLLEESTHKAPTHALHILFRKVFLRVHHSGITLKSLSKRVLRKLDQNEDEPCDVLRSVRRDGKTTISWSRKHWSSLISELLYLLGTRLIQVHFRHYSTSFSYEMKFTNKEVYKQRLKNSKSHFANWWAEMDREEDIALSKDGSKLITTLTQEIVSDCKDDLVNGWQSLIDCCSLLHHPASLSLSLSPSSSSEDKPDINKISDSSNCSKPKKSIKTKKRDKGKEIRADLIASLG